MFSWVHLVCKHTYFGRAEGDQLPPTIAEAGVEQALFKPLHRREQQFNWRGGDKLEVWEDAVKLLLLPYHKHWLVQKRAVEKGAKLNEIPINAHYRDALDDRLTGIGVMELQPPSNYNAW